MVLRNVKVKRIKDFLLLIDFCGIVGKYGVPEPWYFPLSPYYWGCMKSTTKPSDKYLSNSDSGESKVLE